jgi:hypothetical protein
MTPPPCQERPEGFLRALGEAALWVVIWASVAVLLFV